MALLPLLFAATFSPGNNAFPHSAGECRWVHGGLTVANGSGINRLFVSGTHHVLALRDDDTKVPSTIKRFWDQKPWENWLWGDFYVCARERYIVDHMQHVRILKVRRWVITSR
jgi:hypothetical protein